LLFELELELEFELEFEFDFELPPVPSSVFLLVLKFLLTFVLLFDLKPIDGVAVSVAKSPVKNGRPYFSFAIAGEEKIAAMTAAAANLSVVFICAESSQRATSLAAWG
jgi:hypothetical protein